MKNIEQKIEKAADNYSVLQNGRPRDGQFFEVTEHSLDYQVTNAFTSGVYSEIAKEYHTQNLYTEEEVKTLIQDYLGDLSNTYKEIPFDKWFEQNKKK